MVMLMPMVMAMAMAIWMKIQKFHMDSICPEMKMIPHLTIQVVLPILVLITPSIHQSTPKMIS
jgi:hypothetical protein